MRLISRFKFLCASAALVASVAAFAGEPSSEPMLRIDPGEHTAMIRSIATDERGRWLVTASDDKTARVWGLADGRLLSTLRPPQGLGNEGKLFAAALSPDGQTVALGGWTDDENSAYLFERATGRLLRRLTGLPNAINHLAFSPDGRWLAATLGGNNGMRVFASASGQLLAEDRDYGGQSNSAHFSDAKGETRLLTTSTDGLLRLYRFDGKLTLLAKRTAPGGKDPFAARFSPDGQRIAVGFVDTPAVNVLDGDSLALRFAPDTAGVNNEISSVAWSRDGNTLFAAGNAQQNNQFYIRRWAEGGAGSASDDPVAGITLLGLAALPGGRLAFGGSGPTWGVVDAAGKKTLFHAPAVADFRSNLSGFTLSPDGAQVRFGYEPRGRSPSVFDSLSRAFLAADSAGLTPPLLTAAGLNVTDWKNTTAPKLNGAPLKLMQYEISRSLALWPDGAGFALGTEWNLRAFAKDGTQRWQQAVPGSVWGVNVSQDGRWVVAAYGDGTIRWHRASDGAEQLAFYPHPDKKRWVMWTPSGYYDTSPGAEDLIGWHVNRGKDNAADFFPASRFRERFYRPDILAKVLGTQDEAVAVRLANEEAGRRTQTTSIAEVLPPVVELRSASELQTDQSSITLRYTTRSASDAPVTGIRVRVNGQAANIERGLMRAKADGEQEVKVTVPAQDSEIQLFAENKNGVSVPATVRVKWIAKAAASGGGFNIKGKLYVLAIGVAKYTNPGITSLGLSAKDAKDFAAAMKLQTGLYRDVEVKLLTDADATKDNVVDALEWLQKQVTQHDMGMLFMAGHGVNDPIAGYYYLPVNADPDKLKRTGVSMADIRGTLANLTGKAVFFIDTCHAGNVLGAGRRAVSDMNGVINELASAENGVVVFSSSTGKQYSLENPSWGNGAFTKAVVEGIKGGADYQKTGRITHKMLDLFVSERVKQLTSGQQSPVTQAPGGVPDFPVAAVSAK